ncbi:MAG: sigma-70 family RNA polymerase sigma factor [Planctomycetes bacterium]|nr:sigma-70 family RNA polymerase sigma factor [Planctomycetota bacterium]
MKALTRFMLSTHDDASTPDAGRAPDAGERVAALLMKHRTQLLAYLLSTVRHPHDAEDLLQEISLIAIQRREQYREGTNFLAWIHKILRYRLMKYAARSQRSAAVLPPETLDRLAAAEEAPADRNDLLAQRRNAMRECLKALRGQARKVLELRYDGGLGVPQIARV